MTEPNSDQKRTSLQMAESVYYVTACVEITHGRGKQDYMADVKARAKAHEEGLCEVWDSFDEAWADLEKCADRAWSKALKLKYGSAHCREW